MYLVSSKKLEISSNFCGVLGICELYCKHMQASKVSQLVPSFPFSCSHHQQYLLLTHDELREEGGLQKQRFPPLNTLLVSQKGTIPTQLYLIHKKFDSKV